jgi:regulator of nucleoside diphosphate kinase
LAKLSEELKTANIVDEDKMPYDIVRFNSKVTVALNNGIQETLQVVIPMDRDIKTNKISVLTPMGSALFGYSKGDTVLWDFPSGKQQIKITDVQQEETYKGIDVAI